MSPATAVKDAAQILRDRGEQFGENLPANVPMIVHGWSTASINFAETATRPARVGTQINLDLAYADNPSDVKDYHCFSTVLLRQLLAIGEENLPFKATFVRRETSDGRVDETGRRYAAWTIKVD